ncbi:MAG: NAD(P)H-hydrate dehydratase [Helicobacter sp.]|uniref:NAD(P)H-hydrate dehydratase n=1 Tax=Helicobacter sp. TaxID=218 RepID=UPI0025C2CBB5|nr:NAD(P)H-hydrate dehydratase [Helicobacter sp.]MCH5313465.1 NAD(P)H-hydrate dehydratase [Helicobacter sp.]
MKNVYQSTTFLDKRACEKYHLSNEILMENAACALESLISTLTHKGSVITILCGGGDNGGDGYALARRLSGDYHIRIMQLKEPKSPLCQQNYKSAAECEIKFIKKILPCDVMVDCVVGSGLKGQLESDISDILALAQKSARINIACDVPSGLNEQNKGFVFKAHHTLCMGAINLVCLSDRAKDFVGELHIAKLGLSPSHYQISSNIKMLESTDLSLPLRTRSNTHKGDYGHLSVFGGEKIGASILSAQSALHFGAGLVSLITQEEKLIPPEIMQERDLPPKTSAIALGMGLGKERSEEILHSLCESSLPCILDADVFYTPMIKTFLDESLKRQRLDFTQEIILTPHPKEFASLLHICDLGEYTPQKRLDSMLEFTQKYPHTTLLLKGANVYIAKAQEVYINPLGTNALAKGGSGDVLSGIIGALLAQGYDALHSTLQGSLAHALAAQKAMQHTASYALTPQLLIESLQHLHTLQRI